MPPPADPKIYYIVHFDRLPSIIADGWLWCDAEITRQAATNANIGTKIGMDSIKQERLNTCKLVNHPGLYVGECVPFYFCPRSVMLYVIHMANHKGLQYGGGQQPIVHLEADLRECIAWADQNRRRWAFTLSNAASSYFEDRADLAQLDELDWDAITARDWQGRKEDKQAEFLVEPSFPWELFSRIGVQSNQVHHQVRTALQEAGHRSRLEVRPDWYY